MIDNNIKAEMMKCMGEEGTNMLHKIINKAWKMGKLPKDWTTTVILPLHKEGNAKKFSNYKAI